MRALLILALAALAASPVQAQPIRPGDAEIRQVRRGPTDLKTRLSLEEARAARRGIVEYMRRAATMRTTRQARRSVSGHDAIAVHVPPSIPSLEVPRTAGEALSDQLRPLVSQIVAALLLLIVLLVWRRVFARDVAMRSRMRSAYRTGLTWAGLAVLVVITGLYWPTVRSTIHILSLFVLVLAVIQTLTVIVVDGFLDRVRGYKVPVILRDVASLVLFIVISIVVLSNYGVDLTGILTGSVVLTAVVGLAFQDTLGSIASGLALQIERPFQEGDWVTIGENMGRVIEVNWRSTKLITTRNEILVVPNKEITSARLVNMSAPDPYHRREVVVGLPYGAAPNRCKQILEASARTDGVLESPPPFAVLTAFDDSSIRYTLHFYIANIQQFTRIEDRVRTNIWYRLRRAGLSIPFPIRDITVHELKPQDGEQARQQARQRRLSAIEAIPFLEPLSRTEREQLVERITLQQYGARETVIQQGERGDSLFFVEDGEVEVLVNVPGRNEPRRVDVIGPGSFFGEMSLMTGERRRATIRTLTDATFFVIEHGNFREVLDAHSDITERMAEILVRRRDALETDVGEHTAEPTLAADRTDESLLDRIRNFLGR